MELAKKALNKEIKRLDKKIAIEIEQMKHYVEWVIEHIGDPEAVINYGFSRSIANIETSVREYLARRDAFRDILKTINGE